MKSLKPSHGVVIGAVAFFVGYWIGKKKQPAVSGLAILLVGVGMFLCYEAYMAIHDKRPAAPVTTALKAAKS